MPWKTKLTKLLSIDYPIIQGAWPIFPMASWLLPWPMQLRGSHRFRRVLHRRSAGQYPPG